MFSTTVKLHYEALASVLHILCIIKPNFNKENGQNMMMMTFFFFVEMVMITNEIVRNVLIFTFIQQFLFVDTCSDVIFSMPTQKNLTK